MSNHHMTIQGFWKGLLNTDGEVESPHDLCGVLSNIKNFSSGNENLEFHLSSERPANEDVSLLRIILKVFLFN